MTVASGLPSSRSLLRATATSSLSRRRRVIRGGFLGDLGTT
jgi:hypothetical protein